MPKIYQNIVTDAIINKAKDLRSDSLYQQSWHRNKSHKNNLIITYLEQASKSATHIAIFGGRADYSSVAREETERRGLLTLEKALFQKNGRRVGKERKTEQKVD